MVKPWIAAVDLAQPTHPNAAYAIEIASWLLWRLSGEKYAGISTSTQHFDQTNCCLADAGLRAAGISIGLTHTLLPRLRLRNPPVRSIQSVSVAGSAVNPSTYRISNHSTLVNVGDCAGWDLSRGLSVTYTHGQYPPAAGRRAAVKFANEIILSLDGSGECALPDHITSITREGVSYTVLDPMTFVKEGRTGIYTVDMFLYASNPGRAMKRPRVMVPGATVGEHWS